MNQRALQWCNLVQRPQGTSQWEYRVVTRQYIPLVPRALPANAVSNWNTDGVISA
ncbi:hypothetical protein OK016_11185 [Vibrio chagasii]|nr:hypothetical protein [Vibrio chagasii]